jgi:integrase/recombinase XerD
MSIQKHSRPSPLVPKHLSNENVHRILAICDQEPNSHDLGDIIRIMVNTGMRLQELRDLRWSSVDLPNRRLTVLSTKAKRERYIPIGTRTCQLLEARHRSDLASEFVFGSAREKLFRRAAHHLRAIGNQIGFGPISFHTLRHTFALRFMALGGNWLTLSFILGHSTSHTTIKFFPSLDHHNAQAARDHALLTEF